MQIHREEVASFRFSRFFGAFRISLRVKGESFDPFSEDTSSETSAMGSLLADSDSLNRAWKYRGGANLVTFTVAKKRRMSQLVTILLGIVIGAAMGSLLAAFLLSFILSAATPPVLGGTTVCFSILFSQLGI